MGCALRRIAEGHGTADGENALPRDDRSRHYVRSWHARRFGSVTFGGLTLWIMQTGLVLVNTKGAEPADWPSEQPTLSDYV